MCNAWMKLTKYHVPLARRKSAKSLDLGNLAFSGMVGPNGGTSLERVTATLGNKIGNALYITGILKECFEST